MIQFPRSNSLRVIRKDNADAQLQNFDNRLLHEEVYGDYNDFPYSQPFIASDNILVQFASDQGTPTAILLDETGIQVGDKTSDITQVLTGATFNIYNLQFNVAVAGFYQLVCTFANGEIWKSEYFEIGDFGNDKDYVKIEYNTSTNDGILYNNSESFVIRLKGRLVEYVPGQEKTTYNSFSQAMEALQSYPIRKANLELGLMPRYMLEKLNLALGHLVFKVNDVAYQSEGEPDSTLVREGIDVTSYYTAEVELQQTDYESYLVATENTEPAIYPIKIDYSGNYLIFRENGSNFYAKYRDGLWQILRENLYTN